MKTPEQQKEELLEQQRQNILSNHELWMQHPFTASMFILLSKHREQHVAFVATNAVNSSITDSEVRLKAASIRNTDAIIELLRNPTKLADLLQK